MSYNGETINGGSINGSGQSEQEAYELWLRSPSASKVHLVEIDYNGSSAVYPNWITYTLKLSDIPFPGYQDRVKSVGNFTRQIGERFTGTVAASLGEIELSNEDGGLDLWANLSLDGQRVRVYHGDESWDVSRFRLVYECVAEMASGLSWDFLKIRLRGIDYKSDLPIQTNLIPSTTANGSANLPIPKAYGKVFNVSPAIIDNTNQVYQWNDGAVTSVSDVRDGGISFRTNQAQISAVVGNLITTSASHGFVVNTRIRQDRLPSSAVWQAVAWNGNVFCAVAYGSAIAAISTDGVIWTQTAMPVSSNWQSIAWNGFVFCAVSATSGTIAATSPDGITWTARTLPATQAWQAITWNGTVFCAVGNGTASATSLDGITWTLGVTPSQSWQSVSWNGTVFCAVASLTTATITSTNGITWSSNTITSAASWSAITWNGFVFCAVSTGTSSAASTSPDGITWTARTLPSATDWTNVSWNGSVFLAISTAFSGATSPDGITWTSRFISVGNLQALAWNGSIFCAISFSSFDATTSPDGITWTVEVGTLPTPLARSTDYWVIASGLTATAFKLSTTRGGSEITLTNTSIGGCLIGYHWTADLTNGKVYLDQKPAGVLTLDGVAGSTDASTIVVSALSATNVDPASQTRFQAVCNQAVGVYIKDRENRLDIAEKVVNGIGAWYGYGREGLLRFGRVEANPTAYDYELIEDDMYPLSLQVEFIKPEKKHRIGYKYNWTVQDGQLFAGVSADNRVLYSNEYSSSSPLTSTDVGANGSFHALNVIPDVQVSMMALASDALTEASRLDTLYFGWGAIYTVDVGRIGTVIDIGHILKVTHTRFGLSGGVNMTVVYVDDNPSEDKVTLKLFRALPTYAPTQL